MASEVTVLADKNLPVEIDHAAATPMSLLSRAMSAGASMEQLSKLMDLQDRHEKKEAQKAFVAAMAKFKQNPPEIFKTKFVSFRNSKGTMTEYTHAELAYICEAAIKGLAKQNISHDWSPEQPTSELVKVTCTLTHALGGSKSVTMQAGVDDSGGKNPIQAIISTTTYLERVTLLAVTGLAAKELAPGIPFDDDGAASAKRADEPQVIQAPAAKPGAASRVCNENELKVLRSTCDRTGMPEREVAKKFGIPSIEDLPFSRLNDAISFSKSV